MKTNRIYKLIFSALLLVVSFSCKDLLEEDVYIDVGSNTFYQNDEDAIMASNALYAKLRADGPITDQNGAREGWGGFGYGEGSVFNFSEACTDEIYVTWSTGGGFFEALENLSWLPNTGGHFDQMFRDLYEGVRLANDILTNIDGGGDISDAVRDRVRGEAFFARAFFNSTLLSFYGGDIPLVRDIVTNPLDFPEPASEAAFVTSIVEDYTTAAGLLPPSYGPEDYGRFTRGAAYAQLSRFHLNQKNWQEAIDAAREVIALNTYDLSDNYGDIFAADNAGNEEIILSIVCLPQAGIGNTFVAHTAQPEVAPGAWGGHLLRNEFYDTFDPDDIRRTFLQKNYGAGQSVSDGWMIFKYEIDPDWQAPWAGNDIVLHRYAEVLLTLAEALNEQNYPSDEAIDLINEIRERAFPGDNSKLLPYDLSQDSVRNHILAERGWELYMEGYRREDLIRHGQFLEKAQERGVTNTGQHLVKYPIPQVELDRNTKLSQNDPSY